MQLVTINVWSDSYIYTSILSSVTVRTGIFIFSFTFSNSQQGLTSALSVQDPSQRFKGDVMDLRLDIERRKRFAGREREDKRSPGGSRGPSRDRSSEKSGKRHKKSKYVCFISVSANTHAHTLVFISVSFTNLTA